MAGVGVFLDVVGDLAFGQGRVEFGGGAAQRRVAAAEAGDDRAGVVEDGELVAAPGIGRFVPRARFGEPLEAGTAVPS